MIATVPPFRYETLLIRFCRIIRARFTITSNNKSTSKNNINNQKKFIEKFTIKRQYYYNDSIMQGMTEMLFPPSKIIYPTKRSIKYIKIVINNSKRLKSLSKCEKLLAFNSARLIISMLTICSCVQGFHSLKQEKPF